MSDTPTPEEKNEAIRSRYIEFMEPLFFPDDPVAHDIVRYFASLLRIVGIEDKGWDPYQESRALLNDLYDLMQPDSPGNDLVKWRLGLLFYNHIVEMDAPYEVLTNLLRFRLGKGYHPDPFYDFLTPKERKRARNIGLFPWQKIAIINPPLRRSRLEYRFDV